MRRLPALLLAVVLGLLGTLTNHGNCVVNIPVANSHNAAFAGLSANPEEVRCRIWILGKGNPATAGGGSVVAGAPSPTGHDSGTMSPAALPTSRCEADEFTSKNVLYQMAGCAGSSDMYLVLTDWIYPDFDGCPNNRADRVVVFAEDTAGRYGILSRSSSGAEWANLDDVPTVAATEYPRVASAVRTSPTGEDPAVFSLALSGLPTDGSGGYAPGDPPPSPLVTGYELYYLFADSEPAATFSGGWLLCKNGLVSSATPGTIPKVEIPLPPPGKDLYLMARTVFDCGYKGSRGSAPYRVPEEQLLSKIFAFAEAGPAAADWISDKEEQVLSYQVYWAPGVIHAFKPIGPKVPAQGAGTSYQAPYTVPKQFDTFFVRIRADKKDETYEWSRIFLVDQKPPVKPKGEGPPADGAKPKG